MKIHKYISILLLFLCSSIVTLAQSNDYFIHTVSKGQTLYSISRMYNTTVKDIIDLNPKSTTKIAVGQQLKIRQKQSIEELDTQSNSNEGRFHTIKSGETLYRLGQIYKITPQEICAANPGLNISNFRSGEVIFIPRRKSQPIVEQTVTPQKEIVEEDKLKIRTTHKVERGETIYSITRKYEITEEALKEANPTAELGHKKLKRKTILNIPYPKKVQIVKEVEKAEKSNAEIFKQIQEMKDSIASVSTFHGIKVALILPFLLDSYSPNEQARMIEYYEGFLLAVNKLKQYGYSFEINTFDSGSENKSLASLLNSGELDNMDIIIGALYPSHNKELAKFAKEKEIPLVIPFTSKEDEIFRNPMVYVVNTMQSYFFSEVTDHFFKAFPNPNVVFVSDGNDNKKEFVNALTEKLDKRAVTHTTIHIDSLTNHETNEVALSEILQEGKDNIFIPTSSSEVVLSTMLPTLILLNNDTINLPEYKLFGYPEWQIYAGNMDSRIYEVDTYFYASFFSHPTLPETSMFQNDYIKWYNRNIQNIYPRYGMLGYDTGYVFLLAISKFGTEMPNRINQVSFNPVQTGFKFERVNNWGGMINKKIYFIHYTPDYNIEKIDFDKK